MPTRSRLPSGLQHEGIFRVSGAQPRVSEIRDAFERGGDRHSGGGGVEGLARASVIGLLSLFPPCHHQGKTRWWKAAPPMTWTQ